MRFFLLTLAGSILLSNQGLSQTPLLSPGARRSPFPTPTPAQKGSPAKESAADKKETAEERKARFQEAIATLKDRIGDASDKVMTKILDQEKDLRMRLGYFQKPERFDPNSFSNKDEIQSWEKLADQLQQSRDQTAKLYGDASQDLETALVNEKIAPVLAQAIRKEIINTFPWDDIVKKDDLLTTYVGYHRQLLSLFDQNWKTWNSTKPFFTDQKTEADYEKLCQQITSAGKEIETIYARNNL
jgi:hypothetical protein